MAAAARSRLGIDRRRGGPGFHMWLSAVSNETDAMVLRRIEKREESRKRPMSSGQHGRGEYTSELKIE